MTTSPAWAARAPRATSAATRLPSAGSARTFLKAVNRSGARPESSVRMQGPDIVGSPAAGWYLARMGEEADISVVVLSWNTRDLTLSALRSVEAAVAPLRGEAVCVDNASRDGTAAAVREALPGVRVIENAENLGFA